MGKLKRTLDWLETYAERRDLTEEQKEVAAVLARRRIDRDGEDPLPSTIAREAATQSLEEAQ